MGSVLALAMYEQRTDLPGSLVLASAYAGWAGSLPPQEVRRRLEQAARDLEAPPEQILAAGLPTFLTPAAPQDVVDLLAEMMQDIHPAGIRVALNGLGPADLRHVLETIAVPTLLLYGEADRRSPVSVGQDLHARTRDRPWSFFRAHHTWRTWRTPRRSTRPSASSPVTPGGRDYRVLVRVSYGPSRRPHCR